MGDRHDCNSHFSLDKIATVGRDGGRGGGGAVG